VLCCSPYYYFIDIAIGIDIDYFFSILMLKSQLQYKSTQYPIDTKDLIQLTIEQSQDFSR